MAHGDPARRGASRSAQPASARCHFSGRPPSTARPRRSHPTASTKSPSPAASARNQATGPPHAHVGPSHPSRVAPSGLDLSAVFSALELGDLTTGDSTLLRQARQRATKPCLMPRGHGTILRRKPRRDHRRASARWPRFLVLGFVWPHGRPAFPFALHRTRRPAKGISATPFDVHLTPRPRRQPGTTWGSQVPAREVECSDRCGAVRIVRS